jgi:hypothetical protein
MSVSPCLLANFEAFFTAFNLMLEKGNYVTRRQSLKVRRCRLTL